MAKKSTPLDNETFIYLDHKFEQMQKRQAEIDRQHKEDQDKVNDTLFEKLDKINDKVDVVDGKVDYTNGTVRKHTSEIEKLNGDVRHEECPGKEAMTYINDQKSQKKVKKSPQYKLGVVASILAAAYGIYEGIVSGIKFIVE